MSGCRWTYDHRSSRKSQEFILRRPCLIICSPLTFNFTLVTSPTWAVSMDTWTLSGACWRPRYQINKTSFLIYISVLRELIRTEWPSTAGRCWRSPPSSTSICSYNLHVIFSKFPLILTIIFRNEKEGFLNFSLIIWILINQTFNS